MKKYFYVLLLLAPFLLAGQGPSFVVTDQDGNVWDSDSLLAEGTTIVIEFFSPSMTCWPSSNAIQNVTEAYNEMYECNKIFFLQVAQWGYYWTVEEFIEEFGDTSIPYVPGYITPGVNTITGQDLTIEFIDFGLMWAYECWLLRPDGSYEYDLPGMSGLEENALIEVLEDEGFNLCNTIGLEDEWSYPGPSGCCSHCDAMGEHTLPNKECVGPIYDLQGRLLNEKPNRGFYIQGGEKKYILK